MNQTEIALQLTLEAMKHFTNANNVNTDNDISVIAKRTYTLYNSIYHNLFAQPDDQIDN